jgi:hypothetical protein
LMMMVMVTATTTPGGETEISKMLLLALPWLTLWLKVDETPSSARATKALRFGALWLRWLQLSRWGLVCSSYNNPPHKPLRIEQVTGNPVWLEDLKDILDAAYSGVIWESLKT